MTPGGPGRDEHVDGPWREREIELRAARTYPNPYIDVEVWAEFTDESGAVLRRAAFWDGGRSWGVRFAPPRPGVWTWRTFSSTGDPGLTGVTGEVTVVEARPSDHVFHEHGFWRMSRNGRNLVHADGTPAILVGDTAWALPWRATVEQVEVYASDRQAKGFNAALLMSVQPDMKATGPRDRQADNGFDIGFEDLSEGRLNRPNVAYFRYLDRLLGILVAHEIVPVLSPVFQGFGWKGLDTAGTVVPPEEYARYCRYLVARYGARPAMYIVGADGAGDEPQARAGGAEIHAWDCYGQPTGIHYRPHAVADRFQAAPWLDFQSCQTGHEGEHVAERVADMWRNRPVKGVLNGEPTYEHSGRRGKGAGWWQGHEAWSNLCAGGTLGVVYGAASLWQWRLHPAEPGHASYFLADDAGWREALDFEGSTYVGLVAKIFSGLPFLDMEPGWREAIAMRALLVPGRFLLCYREHGGDVPVFGDDVPLDYRVLDPRTGRVVTEGVRRGPGDSIPDAGGEPRLYICVGRGP